MSRSRARTEKLRLPAPGEFLWQYVHSTPLAVVAAELGAESRAALARDVVARWEPFVECDALILQLRVVSGDRARNVAGNVAVDRAREGGGVSGASSGSPSRSGRCGSCGAVVTSDPA